MYIEAVSKECQADHHGCLHVADTAKPKREWRACACGCHVATF